MIVKLGGSSRWQCDWNEVLSFLICSWAILISRTCTPISRVRIPTTARQSSSKVRLVVSTFITLIQYVYINRSSTDGWSTGWRQMSLVSLTNRCEMIRYNTSYQYQISAMHYGSISGISLNDISLRNSILLHVKDVSLKDIKRQVNYHLLNDVSSPIYYQNALRRMSYQYRLL